MATRGGPSASPHPDAPHGSRSPARWSFNKLRTAPATFEEQLRYLAEHSRRFVFPSELGDPSPPSKTIVLTIDDGFRDDSLAARPLLAEYGARATLPPVADRVERDWATIGTSRRDSGGLMRERMASDEEVRATLDSGIREPGAHTATRALPGNLPAPDRLREVADAKTALEARFDTEVASFAVPFGIYEEDDVATVRQAGHRIAGTTDPRVRTRIDDWAPTLEQVEVSGKEGLHGSTSQLHDGPRGLGATLPPVADRVERDWATIRTSRRDSGGLMRERMASDEEVRATLDSGIREPGAHTATRALPGNLPAPDRLREVADAKTALEARFDTEVASFAVPFGIYGEDDVATVRQAGHRIAGTTDPRVRTRIDDWAPTLEQVEVSGKEGLHGSTSQLHDGPRGLGATLPPVADRVERDWATIRTSRRDSGGLMRERMASDEEVRATLDSGIREPGAHTATRALPGNLPAPDRLREVADAKTALEARFDTEVASFAVPFGIYEEDDVATVRQAGRSPNRRDHRPASPHSDRRLGTDLGTSRGQRQGKLAWL